jgi:putative membrane protein
MYLTTTWFKKLFDIDVNSLFHTNRNHYDRFVHLLFGMLAFPYLTQIVDRKKALNNVLRVLMIWAFIQALSMLYEVFEWLLTVILSADAADNYNGQQGDMWDAQKDMALALIGSSVMAVYYLFRKREIAKS